MSPVFGLVESFFADVGARAALVAAVCNAACALVGCFLVLRRMSLMGDALSHAVLPGLVIALIVSGDGGPLPLLLGALGAGLATAVLTRLTQKHGGLAADASLGVVYTTFFALGVVLVKQRLDGVHFDASCIYEGSLLQVALDTQLIGGVEVPRALLTAVPVLLLVVALLAVLWKEWKVTSFDAALAKTMGYAPDAMHYLLMVMVSVVAVTSFESVGSILVIAMLIAPAAAAELLVDRLAPMLTLAAALAVASTVLGYTVAERFDVSPAGCMAVAAGMLYAAAALFSPRHGVVARAVQHWRLALRVRREDVLARLYREQEQGSSGVVSLPMASVIAGGGMLGGRAISQLLRRGQARTTAAGIELTPAGAAEGRRLVRSHRLWESYLVEAVGLPTDHVHDPAHRVEHFLDTQIDQQIEASLDAANQDPHGRRIPEEAPEPTGRDG